MKTIKPIKNEADYQTMLTEARKLMRATGKNDRTRLEILAILIEDYETRHLVEKSADPVDVIIFVMDQQGYNRADLSRLVGASRASDILNRKRAMSLSQIRKISSGWNIPAEMLVSDYDLSGKQVA